MANGKHQNLTEHLVELPGREEKLVPVIALYGANGAGKTNVVRSLHWLRRELLRHGEFVSRERNVFLPESRATRIVVRFFCDVSVYEYGVSARTAVDEEWLSLISRSGSEQIVFERRTDASGSVVVEYGKAFSSTSDRFSALRVLGALPGELFLNRVWRDLPADELTPHFRAARDWFKRLIIVPADAPYLPLGGRVHDDPAFCVSVSGVLRRAGTGVDALSSEPGDVIAVSDLNEQEIEAFEKHAIGSTFARRGRNTLVKVSEERIAVCRLVSRHVLGSQTVNLPFEEESDGTQRLAHLAPALHDVSQTDTVFVVDELDRSLHATLVKEFLREYLTRARGTRSQLIFTTHETHVLDQELLRRDEVWFVEKNKDGASELFSLDDFPVRTDLRLDRSYLQGRFGAVPNIESP